MTITSNVCRECGEKRDKIPVKQMKDGKWKYADKTGVRWNGTIAPCCISKYRMDWSRKKLGTKDRKDQTDPTLVKGYQAELVAKKHFEKMGFKVDHCENHRGPDLVLNGIITVEVKTVSTDKRHKRLHYFIGPINKNRINDDFIAVVLPNNELHIERMSEYLKECRKGYVRNANDLVRGARCHYQGEEFTSLI
jgi:hypothetical protein